MPDLAISKKLVELRKQAGYTQQQIADFLGIKNKSTVGSWEIAKSEPSADQLLKLCALYGVTDILFTFGYKEPSDLPEGATEKEQALLESYRGKPESQWAVDKLLDIN